jgi:disulfide bond formation protein DsbB
MQLEKLWRIRTVNFAAFLIAAGAMLIALFYFQEYLQLAPCPLCVFQRVGMIGAGLMFLLLVIHNPGTVGLRIYNVLGLLASGFGAAIAIRHIWLQNLPEDQVPACGPDLAYMMEAFPFQKMITMVLRGSGECADAQWSLLGLSIPGWTLVVFVILILLQLAQIWKGDFTRKWPVKK